MSSPPPWERAALEGLFHAALAAVEPGACVREALERERPPPGARVAVLAAGKAAGVMAAAAEAELGDALAWGLAVTKDGHGRPLARIELREAAHPVPDARGAAAAEEALARAAARPAPDELLVLLSGGASALWTLPADGLALGDVAATTRALLEAGADIAALNVVRKHLTRCSGGRLASAAAAERIRVLILSDVIDDRLDVIASGPCAPDPSTFAEALAVIDGAGATVSEAVRAHLAAGARGEIEETPGPEHPAFARVRSTVLANHETARAAAARAAAERGWQVEVVPEPMQGEAASVGRRLVERARALAGAGSHCLVASGETTVTVDPPGGRGGRCQELALAAALALEGEPRMGLLAAGTDGSDGPTDAAGAWADGATAARGRAAGADPAAALAAHDSHEFFRREGGLLRTGPTGTNVMDLVLVGCASRTDSRTQ